MVVEEHCGSCHLPWMDTSLDAALHVFDLSEEDWTARMDERQLRDLVHRLSEDRAPGGTDGVALSVPGADQAHVEAYVEAELDRRDDR